ncbi:MAG: hypothetical protein PWP65_466 [Clostridia bacterium]|nr:hypothetical protein [Clostridia bacterium]
MQEAIADFILRPPGFPAEALDRAKFHIIDTIGVMLAGSRDEVGRAIKTYLEQIGSAGKSTVLGWGLKAPPPEAVLANATLAHALDYDDSSWRLIGHPSAVVLPAALAAAEMVGASGAKLLRAYLIGTEISCKLGVLAEPELYENGWHATSIVGVFGATCACAYLFGLDREQIIHALGMAASSASGLRQNFGTMTKPLHAGLAARGGVTAALLALNGFTASHEALCGKWGFFANFAGKKDADAAQLNLGQPWDILEPGFSVKLYPSCAASHTAIDAVLELKNEYGFTAGDVVRVEVGGGPVGPMMLFHRRPAKGTEGKFCMPFLISVAIIEGRVGLDAFSDACVNNPAVQSLMEKVEFGVDPQFVSRSIDDAPALVKVHLRDGRELSRLVEQPRGSPTEPLGREDFIAKYRDCAERVLPAEKVESSLGLILNLEEVNDLGTLIGELCL